MCISSAIIIRDTIIFLLTPTVAVILFWPYSAYAGLLFVLGLLLFCAWTKYYCMNYLWIKHEKLRV